ncbi:MAG: hypothetical protein U5L96_15370 [Owenweeksia sp.]|nr:hypothetical protein [Owenweeksia sp.]
MSNVLDLVKVVPNPYYGTSEYEDSQLDNIWRCANLPDECTISIFIANGTLVGIDKDNSLSFVEWDLKNDFDVPIAGGISVDPHRCRFSWTKISEMDGCNEPDRPECILKNI